MFFGTFKLFRFVSGSTIIAFAPLFIASGIKSVPFFVKPFIATNNPPSLIFLESECILVISKSRLLTFSLTSTLEINLLSNIVIPPIVDYYFMKLYIFFYIFVNRKSKTANKSSWTQRQFHFFICFLSQPQLRQQLRLCRETMGVRLPFL